MSDIVEIAAQVDVDDARLLLNDRSRHQVYRFMSCPLGTVTKRPRLEVRLEDRFQDELECALTCVEYARFADDLVILIDAHPRHDWLMTAVEKRLREELAELQVEINEAKSRIVDLCRGESFGFLGFDFRTALLRKLKDVFRRYQSQPLFELGRVVSTPSAPQTAHPAVDRVVKLINPVVRGWVNYFAVGHSSECFGFVKDWVEKKIRRHMLRARKRQGFGWTRWSRGWLYQTLGLFNGYRVVRPGPKVAPAG